MASTLAEALSLGILKCERRTGPNTRSTMTMEVPPEATYVLIAVITTVAIYYAVALARRLPLPPGPKSKLISGNAHQLPSNEPWKTFAEWSARFGE